MINLPSIANNIISTVEEWIFEYSKFAPNEIKKRYKSYYSLQHLFKATVGIFYNFNLGTSRSLFIFEGIRYINYMKAFNPTDVIIIGSHSEKKYAYENGYGFIWSFPITTSVEIMVSRRISIFLYIIIKKWFNKLLLFNNVKIFLYEDTQSLGVFFNKISTILDNRVTCICIQHGYFVGNLGMRYDGSITEVNFVWDNIQGKLIGGSPRKTFVIGLPYFAKAKRNDQITIIFVGSGTYDDGSNEYEISYDFFFKLKKFLNSINILNIVYRPHPNEWNNLDLINKLKNTFDNLDDTSKVERLNSKKSIFVGTVSSLLYEAGVAGHLIAQLNVNSKLLPLFKIDFKFTDFYFEKFAYWLESNKILLNDEKILDEIDLIDPLNIFTEAILNIESKNND